MLVPGNCGLSHTYGWALAIVHLKNLSGSHSDNIFWIGSILHFFIHHFLLLAHWGEVVVELSTGYSYPREPTPSDVAAKATCWGSGRNYISSECKNRLNAFRFRGPCAHPAEETHLQDICKPKQFVRGDIENPESMDDPTVSKSRGHDMTYQYDNKFLEDENGGKNPREHESPQTDYCSTTMFDDEVWFRDQDELSYGVLGLIHGSGYISGAGAPALFGQAATQGSWSEPYPEGSDEKIILSVDMETVLGQSSEHALEQLGDEPYGCSDDTSSIFGKAPNPLEMSNGPISNDIISTTCERPRSWCTPTLGQLPPPFTEEGFLSDDRVPSTSAHSVNSVKCGQPEPMKISSGGVVVVRCRATDIVRNGKIRWIDVSGPPRRAERSIPPWPLYLDKNGIAEPIERPPLPAVVRERSPIHGLNAGTTVETCFHIKDAVEVAALVAEAKFRGDVLVELFARVLQNRTADGGTRQKFQFCDIFLVGPPFLPGEYAVQKACVPWDTNSRAFVGTAMVRVVGRMKKRNSSREWTLKIENIRDADWGDVDWVRGVVCGNRKN